MKTQNLIRILLFTLLMPAIGFAEDFFWVLGPSESNDWYNVENWKIGGDSQWDPAASTVPVAGTDIVTFRKGEHYVYTSEPVRFGTVNFGDNNYPGDDVNVTFRGQFEADPNYGFFEARTGSSFSFVGGALRFNGHGFNAGESAKLRFSGGATQVFDMNLLTFGSGADIRFLSGVKGTNLNLSVSAFGDNGSYNHLVISDPGTVIDGLTIAGRYWSSNFEIVNGAVITNLTLAFGDQSWSPPGEPWATTRFYTKDVVLEDFKFDRFEWNQQPLYNIEFGTGTTVRSTWWDAAAFASSNGLMRLSGAGTVYTNFTYRLTGRGTRAEITDGAKAFSRLFTVGNGNAFSTMTVSGEDSEWIVLPNDMKQEGVINVGYMTDGRPARNNALIVENGGRLTIDDAEGYKGSEKVNQLLGISVGACPDDSDNLVWIRSGAIVTNMYATAIGGGFTASNNARGGSNNVFRVEGVGTEYHGGLIYNDIWDTELYLGWQTGASNVLEVLDGGLATFTGRANLGVTSDCGSNRIRADNGIVSIANSIDCSPAQLANGSPVLEIGGSNGVIRAAAVLQDAGWNNAEWGWKMRVSIPEKGRSTDEACLALSGAWYDSGKDAIVGRGAGDPSFDLELDLNIHWATSGYGHFATIISVADGDSQFSSGEQRYRYYENGLKAIAEAVDPEQLGKCRLSVVTERANPEDPYSAVKCVKLLLESGPPLETMILLY